MTRIGRLVLDASAALPWLFEDEVTPASEALLDVVSEYGALVPASWFLECAAALAVAERRGRVASSRMAKNVSLLLQLPLEFDETPSIYLLGAPLDLARRHQISAYDATYLDLALRRRLPLATSDYRLQAAANAVGVTLYVTAPEIKR